MNSCKKIFLILIAALWASILICPLAFSGNPTIAVLRSRDIPLYNKALDGFNKALKQSNCKADISCYDLNGRLSKGPKICEELKSKGPDLILTLGTEATEAVSGEITDIPVVFCMVLRPVEQGFVKALDGSGNNLTGVTIEIPPRIQFKTLKDIMPGVRKIGFIFDLAKTGLLADRAKNEAKDLGLEMITFPIHSQRELPRVLEDIRGNIDVLWTAVDSTVYTRKSLRYILLFALRNNLPVIGYSRNVVRAGALFGLTCDYEDSGRQAGELAVKVLNGKKPGHIPIESPRKRLIIINQIVAERIGQKIPEKVLKKADEIFKQE